MMISEEAKQTELEIARGDAARFFEKALQFAAFALEEDNDSRDHDIAAAQRYMGYALYNVKQVAYLNGNGE